MQPSLIECCGRQCDGSAKEDFRNYELEVIKTLQFDLLITSVFEYVQAFLCCLTEALPSLFDKRDFALLSAKSMLHIEKDFQSSACRPLERSIAVVNCVLAYWLSRSSSNQSFEEWLVDIHALDDDAGSRFDDAGEEKNRSAIVSWTSIVRSSCFSFLNTVNIGIVEAVIVSGFRREGLLFSGKMKNFLPVDSQFDREALIVSSAMLSHRILSDEFSDLSDTSSESSDSREQQRLADITSPAVFIDATNSVVTQIKRLPSRESVEDPEQEFVQRSLSASLISLRTLDRVREEQRPRKLARRSLQVSLGSLVDSA